MSSSLFKQTEPSASKIPSTEEGFLDDDADLPTDPQAMAQLTNSRDSEIMSTLKAGAKVLDTIQDKTFVPISVGISQPTATMSKKASSSMVKESQILAKETPHIPPSSQPQSTPERLTQKVIPEPYPGAGKGISDTFARAWSEIEEKIRKLPLMSPEVLKQLGVLELETDHGKVSIPPYLQLLTRFASKYYGDTVACVHADQVLKNIATCYKSILMKKVDTQDIEAANFSGTINELGVLHWVQVVGSILFDVTSITSPNAIDNYSRDDFQAALDQLSSLYPDAQILYNALSMITIAGAKSVAPIPPYLLYDKELGKYLNTYCKGSLDGSKMATIVTQRTTEFDAASVVRESAQAHMNPSSLDEESGISEVDPVTGQPIQAQAKLHQQDPVIRTSGGMVNLAAEHSREKGAKERDTSKFVQNLEIRGLKADIDQLKAGQASITDMLKVIIDKLEAASKRQERTETATAKVLTDICHAMTTLVSQRSLTDLKLATPSAISSIFLESDTEEDLFGMATKIPQDVKGKGEMGSKKKDLSERLSKFDKSDCASLIDDLKTMFTNAGQPNMAAMITEKMLMKDIARINLANSVEKFKSFY